MKSVLKRLLTWLLIPFLLFEEWGWQPLARLAARLARLPLLHRLETWITRLSPWAALAMFALPGMAMLPVKIVALYLMGTGHKVVGMGVLIAAKLVGTAIVARLFQLTEPALMQLKWFARWYPRWKAWKDRVLEMVRSSPLWQQGRQIREKIRHTVRRWRGDIS
jgi:hypothetical protein